MSEAKVPPLVGEARATRTVDKLRLGGMALRNGLLVHGPTHWAAAVRDRDGEIRVASGRKPSLGGRATEAIPGLRGVTKLAEAMAVIPLVKRALPAAKLPMEDLRVVGAMAGAALLGQAIRSTGARTVAREAAVGAVSLAPALLRAARRRPRRLPRRGAQVDRRLRAGRRGRRGRQGARPLRLQPGGPDARRRRRGQRGRAQGRPARPAGRGRAWPWAAPRVAVEVFAYAERHDGSRLSDLLRRPGYEIQRVVGTQEPSEEQLAVGRAALAEILRVEGAA